MLPVYSFHAISNDNVPLIQLPNIIFPDAIATEVTNYYIKLFPGGMIFYNQHIVMTLVESSFNYLNYPNDQQDIILRYFPYEMNTDQVIFQQFLNDSVVKLATSNDGQSSFSQNPVWTYLTASAFFEGGKWREFNCPVKF